MRDLTNIVIAEIRVSHEARYFSLHIVDIIPGLNRVNVLASQTEAELSTSRVVNRT